MLSRYSGVGARRRNPERSEGSGLRGNAEREPSAEILSRSATGAKSKDLLFERASEPSAEILSRSATGAKSKDLLDRHERSREPDDQRELPAEILTLSLSKGKDVANDQFFLDHFYSLFAQP